MAVDVVLGCTPSRHTNHTRTKPRRVGACPARRRLPNLSGSPTWASRGIETGIFRALAVTLIALAGAVLLRRDV